MKTYLSGPVSLGGKLNDAGIVANVQRFKTVASVLREEGFEILSPVELPVQPTWEMYMRLCIEMVCQSDAVLVLPGFGDSRGSIFEVLVANTIGIPVFAWPERPFTHV